MLVEDSNADRELVRRVLQSPETSSLNVTVHEARDASAALAALQGRRFGLLLLDNSLPSSSGVEILHQLRATGDRTPAILMSGTGDQRVVAAALRAGAADFIFKELGFELTLPTVLERVLREHKQQLEVLDTARRLHAENRRLRFRSEQYAGTLSRAVLELEELRRFSEQLTLSTEVRPALALVTRTACEIIGAQAAALLAHAGEDEILVSAWGDVNQPIGTKGRRLEETLGQGMHSTLASALHDGNRNIGSLWAARTTSEEFGAHEHVVLQTIASVAALAVARIGQSSRSTAEATPASTTAAPQPIRLVPRGAAKEAGSEGLPDLGVSKRSAISERPTQGQAGAMFDAAALKLPMFPLSLVRLIATTETTTDVHAIESVLLVDPVLCARIVCAANTAAIGRARAATSVREAAMVLGARGVRNFAVASFARGLIARSGPVETLLWEQSIGTAIRTQAALEQLKGESPDSGYLGGLFHNVGTIALNNAHPERYEAAVRRAMVERRVLSEVERETLGSDGSALTVALLAHWQVPVEVARILRASPDSMDGKALGWAAHATLRENPARHVFRAPTDSTEVPQWLEDACAGSARELGLADPKFAVLEHQSRERIDAMRELIGQPRLF